MSEIVKGANKIKQLASKWALENADKTMETNSALNRGFIAGYCVGYKKGVEDEYKQADQFKQPVEGGEPSIPLKDLIDFCDRNEDFYNDEENYSKDANTFYNAALSFVKFWANKTYGNEPQPLTDKKYSVCDHHTEKYGKCLKCGDQVFNDNYDSKPDKKIEEEESTSIRAINFEVELFRFINKHVTDGLSKPDLVSKMKYVLKSCEMS